MLRRRTGKSSKTELRRTPLAKKQLLCEKCGKIEVMVDEDISAVTCHMCCAHMGPQIVTHQPKEVEGPHRPRGWQKMKQFVDSDGNVYHKGIEQPSLKGTLSATIIVKKSKFEREKAKAEKEARLAKRYERKMEKLKKQEAKKEQENN